MAAETASRALMVAAGFMTIAWAASLILRRTDVADVAWGLVFVVIAWWGLFFVAGYAAPWRARLAAALVTVWGLRLSLHIARRNFGAGRTEDERYAAMRARAGRAWPLRSLVSVFWLQGALAWVVGWPVIAVMGAGAAPLGFLELVAVLVWCVGFAVEVIGDRQLARWLADPAHRGMPLTTGLWAWTRHPNYLGDALAWWGIGLLALRAPWGVIALVGPLLMTLLLRYVSGVPLLERRHVGEPEWERYRSRVPVFWPRIPRDR